MIDIHCHILPGLDDGADSYNESMGIARELISAGFDTVIATPHVIEGREYNTPATIREKVHELNQVFRNNGIQLQVLPGAENYIFPDLAQWYKEDKIISLADTKKYILIELPMMNIPHYTEQVLFELQILGITPIIAHPERNRELFHNPEILVAWSEKGINLQVNLGSFTGRYGSSAKNLAKTLLLSDMAHFVASDMHRVPRKSSYLKTSINLINEVSENSRNIAATVENPAHILEGVSYPMQRSYTLFTGKRQGTWDWMKTFTQRRHHG